MSLSKENKYPEIRFKGFTEAWEQRKLEEVAKITMGQSPAGENYTENQNDHILVQGNADMKNGKVVPRIWTTQITKTATPDDIILSVRAPVGDVGKTDYSVVLGRGVAGVKGNEFIYQTLLHFKRIGFWAKYTTGSTFESINSQDLKKALINIPSEKEQFQIGEFLKRLDKTIALHQGKLEKLKSLKKAYLQVAFPDKEEKTPKVRFENFTEKWEQRKWNTVMKVKSGKDYKHLDQGEIPVYGTGGYMLSVNDALSNEDSIGIGRKGTIDKPQYLAAPFWTVDTLFYMTPLKNNNLHFLYFLSQKINWKKLDESTGVPSLSKVNIEKINQSFPNVEEQLKIGCFFDQFDKTIALHQNKLNKLSTLKKAYLKMMFI